MESVKFSRKTYQTDNPLIEEGVFVLKTERAKIHITAKNPNSVVVVQTGTWNDEEAK